MQSTRLTSDSAALLSELTFFRTEVLNKKLIPTKTNSKIAPPQAPSRKIVYEHSSTCLHSDSPESIILSKSAIHLLLVHQLAHLAKLREKYVKYEVPDDIIEHAKLLQEVKANYLGRGVYLRRCNGQFVNVLGEVIGEKTAVELNDGNENSLKAMYGYAAENGPNLPAPAVLLEAKEESLLDTPVIFSTAFRESSIDDAHESANSGYKEDGTSDTGSEITITAATTPTSSLLTPPISAASTAVIPSPANAAPTQSFFPFDGTAALPNIVAGNALVPNSIAPHITVPERITQVHQKDASKAQPSGPAIPFSALQQREMLVRAGRMDDGDLIMTCWAVNKQVINNDQ